MSKPVSKAASCDSCGRSDLNGWGACWVWPSIAYSTAQQEHHQQARLSRRYKEGGKELGWLSLSRYVQHLLPGRATMTPLAAQ